VVSARRGQRGFTILEVLVAVGIMAIGMAGIIGLMRVSAGASGFSRRATEAAILAEDKLEWMRTVPLTDIVDGSDVVDASGVVADAGFTRAWTIEVGAGDLYTIVVSVSWDEGDGGHTTTFRTVRSL